MMEFLAIFLSIACFFADALVIQADPVVSTTYGNIRGSSKKTAGGFTYDVFLGIPFGKPPVGDLRWQKPVPPKPWEGVRDAKEWAIKCTQVQDREKGFSEDCLFLNVYVPGSSKHLLYENENLPVIFWVHGGAFLFGATEGYPGELLATNGRVIVVSPSYRLSTLGFLSTESDAAPGNYGLWDQVAALKWVRDNIARLGGDSSRVTIMGQSAGSASVSQLSLSPVAKGLFQRVIALSGSAASFFGGTTLQPLVTRRIAESYNCPTTSDEDIVDCLRAQSASSLDERGVLIPPLQEGVLFSQIPVVDGELVPISPIDAMEQGVNSDYDLLAGSTMHDGAPFAMPFTGNTLLVRTLVNLLVNVYENREEVADLVYERFPGALSRDLETRQRTLTKMGTDYVFGSRALKEVELHSQLSSRGSYLYEFRHQYTRNDPEWLQGIHGEDVPFVLGQNNLTGANAQLSQHIQAYYCNFAYTGNPNEGPHAVPVEWPRFDPSKNNRLVQSPEPFVEEIPQDLLDDLEFWNNIYDKIAIPRRRLPDVESNYNLGVIGMWNILMKEIQKSMGNSIF